MVDMHLLRDRKFQKMAAVVTACVVAISVGVGLTVAGTRNNKSNDNNDGTNGGDSNHLATEITDKESRLIDNYSNVTGYSDYGRAYDSGDSDHGYEHGYGGKSGKSCYYWYSDSYHGSSKGGKSEYHESGSWNGGETDDYHYDGKAEKSSKGRRHLRAVHQQRRRLAYGVDEEGSDAGKADHVDVTGGDWWNAGEPGWHAPEPEPEKPHWHDPEPEPEKPHWHDPEPPEPLHFFEKSGKSTSDYHEESYYLEDGGKSGKSEPEQYEEGKSGKSEPEHYEPVSPHWWGSGPEPLPHPDGSGDWHGSAEPEPKHMFGKSGKGEGDKSGKSEHEEGKSGKSEPEHYEPEPHWWGSGPEPIHHDGSGDYHGPEPEHHPEPLHPDGSGDWHGDDGHWVYDVKECDNYAYSKGGKGSSSKGSKSEHYPPGSGDYHEPDPEHHPGSGDNHKPEPHHPGSGDYHGPEPEPHHHPDEYTVPWKNSHPEPEPEPDAHWHEPKPEPEAHWHEPNPEPYSPPSSKGSKSKSSKAADGSKSAKGSKGAKSESKVSKASYPEPAVAHPDSWGKSWSSPGTEFPTYNPTADWLSPWVPAKSLWGSSAPWGKGKTDSPTSNPTISDAPSDTPSDSPSESPIPPPAPIPEPPVPEPPQPQPAPKPEPTPEPTPKPTLAPVEIIVTSEPAPTPEPTLEPTPEPTPEPVDFIVTSEPSSSPTSCPERKWYFSDETKKCTNGFEPPDSVAELFVDMKTCCESNFMENGIMGDCKYEDVCKEPCPEPPIPVPVPEPTPSPVEPEPTTPSPTPDNEVFTNEPTFGSTPTVSKETTGPPTIDRS